MIGLPSIAADADGHVGSGRLVSRQDVGCPVPGRCIFAASVQLPVEREYRARELIVQLTVGFAMPVEPAPHIGIAAAGDEYSIHSLQRLARLRAWIPSTA